MSECSSGSKLKRKLKSTDLPSTTESAKLNKIPLKFINTRRGLFKDLHPIYESDNNENYPVLISSTENIKLDIFKVNNVIKHITDVLYVKPAGNFFIKVFFKNKNTANSFLLNTNLLLQNKWSAKIPYDRIESQGIIKVSPEITEEDLLINLKTTTEIIGVKRFNKRLQDGSFSPLPTVLVTFLSTSRPDHVIYDHIWFRVQEYIRPLLQCFNCYKFHHSSSVCKNKQVCSICAGSHYFKSCNNKEQLKCVNCNGDHTAISYSCPVKSNKISEIKKKIMGKATFANVTKGNISPASILKPNNNTPVNTKSNDISLMQKRNLMSEILNSDIIVQTLTKTLIDIFSKKETEGVNISSKLIKEMLINNITNNG